MEYFSSLTCPKNLSSSMYFPIGRVLNNLECSYLTIDFSDEDIKSAFFNTGFEKALGPDGLTSKFFKDPWDITCPSLH